MIRELLAAADPPENLADFMSKTDMKHQLDEKLTKGLQAVLPQTSKYLAMDDSRDVLKELTHETRNVAKELRDDSRNVLKDRAPRTIEWGNNIEVTPIATGSVPSYSAPGSSQRQGTPRSFILNPALTALETARKMREAMENEIDSDNEVPVKMEVDPPLKTSSTQGAIDAPIDLTSDSDSDKENDSDHPGITWIRYDRTKVDHYRIDIPKGDLTSAALFIRYVFDGEETILEGCNGKHGPIYCKALHTRSADTHPNL